MSNKFQASDALLQILKEYQVMFWKGTACSLQNVICLINTHKKGLNLLTLREALQMDLRHAEKRIRELTADNSKQSSDEKEVLCN